MATTKAAIKKDIIAFADAIAANIINKKMKIRKEEKDLFDEKDLNAVTLFLNSGCKIRIRTDGETYRPDHTKMGNLKKDSPESGFFFSLRYNKELAKAVHERLLPHAQSWGQGVPLSDAAKYAEML